MESKNWKIIEKIYDQAIDLNAEDQLNFVQNEAKGEKHIITQVMKMLDSQSNDFMDNFPGKLSNEAFETSLPKNLGHFKILKKIATGGMGRVYLAQSTQSDVPIKVALKTIRVELLNQNLKNRFQNEKLILSRLRHKNIASLIDAGVSNENIPYIATEWIDGENIKEYCIQNKLSLKKRLCLILQICNAVSFAHNKLIVHRDLKPENILIDSQGQVKLLDFGIAKIIDVNQSPKTQTQIFTPDYASPEQLNGEVCTVATDIYSLGVLMFELLTNSKRFNLADLAITEKIKAIATPKPAELSDFTPDHKLNYSINNLKGALYTIINKAMHVEPERRYGSVSSLVSDIENYLENRPIKAMDDSVFYKTKMLILRNKLASSFLILAFIGISTGLIIANKQLVLKDKEARKSQAMLDFFDNIMITASPEKGGSLNMTVREMFVKGIKNFDLDSLEGSYEKAEIANRIGLLQSELGQQKESLEYLKIAVDYYLENLSEGDNANQYMQNANQVANALIINNEEDNAKKYIKQSLKNIANYKVEHDKTGLAYIYLAKIHGTYGADFNKETAFEYFNQAESVITQLSNDNSKKFELLGEIYFLKQQYFFNTNTFDEALGYLNKAESYFNNLKQDPLNPKRILVMTTKADLYSNSGLLKEAEQYFDLGNEYYFKLYSRYSYITLANQAKNFYHMGDFTQSFNAIKQSEDIFIQDKKAKNLNYYILLLNKTNALVGLQNYTHVQNNFSEILEYMKSTLTENLHLIKSVINFQTAFYIRTKNTAGIQKSKQYLIEYLNTDNKELKLKESIRLVSLINLATIYMHEKDYELAFNFYNLANELTDNAIEKYQQGWLYSQLQTGLFLSEIKLGNQNKTVEFHSAKKQLLDKVSEDKWFDEFYTLE